MVVQSSRFLIHCPQPRHLSWLVAGGRGQGTPRSLGLCLFHPSLGLHWRPKRPYSSHAGTEQGMDPPPPMPLPASVPVWSILTWAILPLLPPSTAPAPSLPRLEFPGTPHRGSAAAPTHGERNLGSISLGAQLPGVIFHQRMGSEPCPSPDTLSREPR